MNLCHLRYCAWPVSYFFDADLRWFLWFSSFFLDRLAFFWFIFSFYFWRWLTQIIMIFSLLFRCSFFLSINWRALLTMKTVFEFATSLRSSRWHLSKNASQQRLTTPCVDTAITYFHSNDTLVVFIIIASWILQGFLFNYFFIGRVCLSIQGL